MMALSPHPPTNTFPPQHTHTSAHKRPPSTTSPTCSYLSHLLLPLAERALCSIFMMASGMIWTYVLGTFAGIAATLDPNGVLFHNTMDQ